MEKTDYIYRNIAQITLEAATPILVGTGSGDLITDALAVKDINGLPYLPATSIAGVLRHALQLNEEDDRKFFGFQDKMGGQGSQIIFTDGVMVGKEGKAMDGLMDSNDWKDPFYEAFRNLPVRQHVRISDKGTAENNGKFDNEVVYQGTRFVFEIEMVTTCPCQEMFERVLAQLYDKTLRLGSNTRSGYGKVRVVKCLSACLDLTKPEDLDAYLTKPTSLAKEWTRWKPFGKNDPYFDKEQWIQYQLKLKPVDFFMIGSGLGDDEADNTPMAEHIITWNEEGKPQLSKKPQVLIPGSSIKGALAHRTAYRYNKLLKRYIGNPDAKTGTENEAVARIFGKKTDGNKFTRGCILIDDIIKGEMKSKLFYHNKIDAFTGGTIDGALFQEKAVQGRDRGDDCQYTLKLYVNTAAFKDDTDGKVREAFEQSLQDLCCGMLPLGGATARGYGMFEGSYSLMEKNNHERDRESKI